MSARGFASAGRSTLRNDACAHMAGATTRHCSKQTGFSIIELAVSIVVIALLLGAILVPLNTQLDQNRLAENKSRIDLAREALLGFAASQSRLPCPDDPSTTTPSGAEEFAVGGDAANGNCSVWVGYLPAVTLGLSNLTSEGLFPDGWGTSSNAMWYAVSNANVGGANVFTNTGGAQRAGLASLTAGPPYLYIHICASGTGVVATDCGTAPILNEGQAVFVVFSLGKNAPQIISGTVTPDTDEAANRDNDFVFVSHLPTSVAGNEFDDDLEWVGIYSFLSRMISAGTLP